MEERIGILLLESDEINYYWYVMYFYVAASNEDDTGTSSGQRVVGTLPINRKENNDRELRSALLQMKMKVKKHYKNRAIYLKSAYDRLLSYKLVLEEVLNSKLPTEFKN